METKKINTEKLLLLGMLLIAFILMLTAATT